FKCDWSSDVCSSDLTAAMRLLDQQELVVGRLLNLDEVRHLCDFLDLSEELADAFPTGESLCHRGLSLRPPHHAAARLPAGRQLKIGRASCRERVDK